MIRLRLLWLCSLCLFACPTPVEPGCDDGGTCMPPPDGGGNTCAEGTHLTGDGRCITVGWATCPAGFTADPAGAGCTPTLPTDGCAAGTMPLIGGSTCQPVGWSMCPTEMMADPSGWGCTATLPTTPCTGATRERIGSATCVPVGDCAAPFPPAAATHFVDDSYTPGQVDATHFTSIVAALAAAPAGSTIAIEAGAYTEHLVPTRAVTLVGRCPEQVTLVNSNPPTPAIDAAGIKNVVVQGFTIRNSDIALYVDNAGSLTARQMVLDANRISGTQGVGAGTVLTIEDSVVRGTLPEGGTPVRFGQGVAAGQGAKLVLTDVAIVDNLEIGVFVSNAGSVGELTRVVVQGTKPRASTGRTGFGVAVQSGAAVTLTHSVLRDNTTSGLLVAQAGSKATVRDVLIRGTKLGKDGADLPIGTGIGVQAGGSLDLDGAGVVDSATVGLHLTGGDAKGVVTHLTVRGITNPSAGSRLGYASERADLRLTDSVFVDGAGGGLDLLGGATANLARVLVAQVSSVPTVEGSGVGLRSESGSQLTANQVSISRASGAGVLASLTGVASLVDLLVRDTQASVAIPPNSPGGWGLAAITGGSLTVDRALVERSIGGGAVSMDPATSMTLSNLMIREVTTDENDEYGQGVVAQNRSAVQLTDVGVLRTHTAGLQVSDEGSIIAAVRTTVSDGLADKKGHRGRGVNAQFQGRLLVSDSLIRNSRQVAVFAFESNVTLDDTVVTQTKRDGDGAYGNALEVLTNAKVVMTGGAIEGSEGIGAVYAEAAGSLDGVRIESNTVGLHVQDGSMLMELDTAPAELSSRQVAVTPTCTFVDNEARLGSGTVPVPAL